MMMLADDDVLDVVQFVDLDGHFIVGDPNLLCFSFFEYPYEKGVIHHLVLTRFPELLGPSVFPIYRSCCIKKWNGESHILPTACV